MGVVLLRVDGTSRGCHCPGMPRLIGLTSCAPHLDCQALIRVGSWHDKGILSSSSDDLPSIVLVLLAKSEHLPTFSGVMGSTQTRKKVEAQQQLKAASGNGNTFARAVEEDQIEGLGSGRLGKGEMEEFSA
ncbi:hypothetical protein HPP92_028733 [Vanilla planifolia]|uniref:Uncharacterized protein n=1 Tax=Vanilla planifolia TaxID=51239 RepID=A0A835P4Z8_VANPL|nr:hypothetical protein HPP92_028733 [Vanilla planifolia]KAG0446679.1 hypothetical protein HPP92_028721 [Vanilla planifolia]